MGRLAGWFPTKHEKADLTFLLSGPLFCSRSVVPQRVDGIQKRGLFGRQIAEDHTNTGGHAEGDQDCRWRSLAERLTEIILCPLRKPKHLD